MKFQSLNNWLAEQTVKGKKFIDNGKRDYYGCVMMDTKIDDWEEQHLAGIDEDDIHIKPLDDSYGLEQDPHITVLFGIHEDQVDAETVKELIKHNMKPVTVDIDEVDYFPGEEYDVVKYNVPVTDELLKYRELFSKFPNTQTYPEYKPHMTIAYVKPGMGKKYKRKLREPFQVTFTKGTYSDHPEGDPDKFTRKQIDLEKDYGPKSIKEDVNFERGVDPKKSMNIGEDRERTKSELIKLGAPILFKEVYPWIQKESQKKGKMIPSIVSVKSEIMDFIEMVYDTFKIHRLSELTPEIFKEYWKDIYLVEKVNFERGADPKKSMNIGKDRILSYNELMKQGTEKIFPVIKKFLASTRYAQTITDDEVRNEIREYLDVAIDLWGWGRLSDVKPNSFIDYWHDTHEDGRY